MKVDPSDQVITINAPRSLVFQMFSSFGEEKPSDETGEGATVMERDGNRLLVEFFSRDRRNLYRALHNQWESGDQQPIELQYPEEPRNDSS